MRLGKDPHGTPQRCDEYVSGRHSDHRHHENHGPQDRKGVHEIHQDYGRADCDGVDESSVFQREIKFSYLYIQIKESGI